MNRSESAERWTRRRVAAQATAARRSARGRREALEDTADCRGRWRDDVHDRGGAWETRCQLRERLVRERRRRSRRRERERPLEFDRALRRIESALEVAARLLRL